MKTQPPTKYPAIRKVDLPLADWLDTLPEITTLATVREQFEKMADEWVMCSATPESRVMDTGAASCAPCVRHMLQANPLFLQLHSAVMANYGAHHLVPNILESHLDRLAEHIAKLVGLYGPGVPIQQVQNLDVFPEG